VLVRDHLRRVRQAQHRAALGAHVEEQQHRAHDAGAHCFRSLAHFVGLCGAD